MRNQHIRPSSWLSVALVAFPGLLLGFAGWLETSFIPLLPILGYMYLGILLLFVPLIWYGERQFPSWALMVAGILLWLGTFMLGMGLAEQINKLNILDFYLESFTVPSLISVVLSLVVFVIILRRERLSLTFWIVIGTLVLGNLLLAVFYSLSSVGMSQVTTGMFQYFVASGVAPIDGLLFVAIGLLAARHHGSLAMLVVIGGYCYICTDSDYLFGYPMREWALLPIYLAAMKLLYLAVLPVGLLRARTQFTRAIAVFIPLAGFHFIRLALPYIVIQQKYELRPGDVVFSINIVLIFILAWVLYRSFDVELTEPDTKISVDAIPLPG